MSTKTVIVWFRETSRARSTSLEKASLRYTHVPATTTYPRVQVEQTIERNNYDHCENRVAEQHA
jgi:hypothetical protein